MPSPGANGDALPDMSLPGYPVTRINTAEYGQAPGNLHSQDFPFFYCYSKS